MAEDERLFRELYAESSARPRAGHPDEEAWEALAMGELPPARKAELADHAVRCLECASIYRGLTMLAREAARFDPEVPRPRRARVLSWPTRWAIGGVAAAAAIALVALLPFLRPLMAPAPGTPVSDDPLRSGERPVPVPLEPKGPVADHPRTFRWRGIPGVERYRLQVSRGDGEPLWVSPPVEGTSIDWPASVTAEPGVYYWQVVALPGAERAAGSPALSELVSFEIAARR